ncbi:MAG TPA: response regulator transcription factor [Chloroflexota bacterium]|jgi:DNA-binding response OmpR family regulator|nr:response regulator transcription factor [Chloroflexota bacterium]
MTEAQTSGSKGQILVVDDEPNIARLIRMYLDREGFETVVASSGAEALARVASHKPALVILDIMLPDVDGLEVCREIRRESGVPIIMLTAREGDEDKIVGLELGADDYVTKPFVPRELVARVKAILRRSSKLGENTGRRGEVLDFGELKIEPDRREVWLDGKSILLRAKEYDLLTELARRPGIVFTREQLLQNVWGYDFLGDSGTIDVHVRRLRAKLDDDSSNPRFIETVWGVGYRFKDAR